MISKKKTSKLIFVTILFLLLFSFPFLKMMNKDSFIGSVPILYFYVVLLWFICIAIIALVVELKRKIPAADE